MIYEHARSYLGTRFVHRGRNKRGLDCVGLVWCAYRDAGIALEDYRLYAREPQKQDGLVCKIEAALGAPVSFFGRVKLKPDDVIVVRFEVEPHHVGIVGSYKYGGLSVIHACGHNEKVVEHRLSDDMVNRITHVFRRPA